MLMLTGDTRKKAFVERLKQEGWGRIWIDQKPTPYDGEPWGFDNGVYRDYLRGQAFNSDAYRKRLDKAYTIGRPYLAVAPDIMAGGDASLDYSLEWLDKLPRDWPWYLAIQDDMDPQKVLQVIDGFYGLFLGGSDAFKLEAPWWAALAHTKGKRFHYGRAGTPVKVRQAYLAGSDSADSAFPLWKTERMDELIWLVRHLPVIHEKRKAKFERVS